MLKSVVPRLLRISCTNSIQYIGVTDKFCLINSTNLIKRGYVTLTSVTRLPEFINSKSQIRYFNSKTEPKSDTKSSNDGTVLIYTGKFSTRIRMVKVFSLSTSVFGLVVQPILLEQGMKIGGAPMATAMCATAGFFTFVTPVLLHLITKKYAIDVTYNPQKDEYTATIISLFLIRKKITFKVDDITIPEIGGMFTSFVIGPKRIPIFVDPLDFTDLKHYSRFMGYDKAIDFKLDSEPDGKEFDLKLKHQK